MPLPVLLALLGCTPESAPTPADTGLPPHTDEPRRIRWQPDGVAIDDPDLDLELVHAGWGRTGALRPFPASSATREADRTVFPGAQIDAWYRELDLGLEQGFTVHERPEGDGWLEVRVDLLAAETPSWTTEGILWVQGDRTIGRYHGLVAWDADGRRLPSHLALDCEVTPCQVVLADCRHRTNGPPHSRPPTADCRLLTAHRLLPSAS
ncbi:MAG: hypothetical protein KC656_21185, partial [Myxococcales bacterium]|nr:hypothetical protein [Myxococcales bacterium]